MTQEFATKSLQEVFADKKVDRSILEEMHEQFLADAAFRKNVAENAGDYSRNQKDSFWMLRRLLRALDKKQS